MTFTHIDIGSIPSIENCLMALAFIVPILVNIAGYHSDAIGLGITLILLSILLNDEYELRLKRLGIPSDFG